MPAQVAESNSGPTEENCGLTGISVSGTDEIESAKPKARLRSCANPLYPALLEIARMQKKDLDLLLTILWSINAPPSLRALPRVARNLRRSLLILQQRCEVDLAAAGMGEWPELLEWLASDPDVNQLCYGRKRKFSGVLYHCASTHSFYALLWETVSGGLAYIRACLLLFYVVQAPGRVTREDYEHHLREGSDVLLLAHNPYDAWHAFHNLLPSAIGRELFREIARTRSLQDLQVMFRQIHVKHDDGAVLLHLPALKRYFTRLAEGIPPERITAITSKQRKPSGPKSNPLGSAPKKSKTIIHTVETSHGKVGMTRSTPRLDEGKARRLLEADTDPREVRKGEDVWIATPPVIDVDPAAHAAVFREAARAMHKPTELLRSHQRNLSTNELSLLLNACHETALQYASSDDKSSESRRKLVMLATTLCSLFTWSEVSDAAETWIFGPGTINAHSRHGIFLAEAPAYDHFRIEALVPEYTTAGKFDPALFWDMADYGILPLPPIVGLLIRTLFAEQLKQGFEQPLRLTRNDPGLEVAIERFLKKIDQGGRLSLSRIRESIFSRVVAATRGDVALSSLVFAKKHYTVDAELYYLAYGAREVARIYLDVTERIHAAAFPDWTSPEVDIHRMVPEKDLGCRYYPKLTELIECITEIRKQAVEAWRQLRKRKKFNPKDTDFQAQHNILTLYVCLRFAYATGVRAVTSPVPKFGEIIEMRLDDERMVGVADWSDKDDPAHYHKRELFLDQDELKDLKSYSEYIKRVGKSVPGPKTTRNASCFYIFNSRRKLVTPAVTAKLFGDVYPYPPNTHRRVLSREARLAGMSPEIIRAGVLGHWSADREPWSALSGLSLPAIRDAILRHVPPILRRLGFVECLEKAVSHE